MAYFFDSINVGLLSPVLDTGGGGFSNMGGEPVFGCIGREALVSILAVLVVTLIFGTTPVPDENVILPSTGRLEEFGCQGFRFLYCSRMALM